MDLKLSGNTGLCSLSQAPPWQRAWHSDCGGGRDSVVMEVRFGEDERQKMADAWMNQEDGPRFGDLKMIWGLSKVVWNSQ